MEKIDFVIMWVDGNNIEWQKEKNKYRAPQEISVNRYRDWGFLKYWFRGVEKFAPWVNNIYFITPGYFPDWLNLENEKLKFIDQKEFIPEKYNPTFNANAIDLNLCNISELSENFVYFNDDMFLLKNVKETDFFKNGKPCDEFSETALIATNDVFTNMQFNNMYFANKHYSKQEFKKKHFSKYLNLKYGFRNNMMTLCLTPWKNFSLINNPHICQSFLKSSFRKFWELEPEIADKTCTFKFRDKECTTQYAVRFLQLLDGNFVPRKSSFGHYFEITNNNKKIVKTIKNQKYKCVCLNDSDSNVQFEKAKNEIIEAFERILPNKSSFEK